MRKVRYLNIPRKQRLCDIFNEIEDEARFLDKCKKKNMIRYDHSYSTTTVQSADTKSTTKPSVLLCIDNIQNALAKVGVGL